MLDPRQYELDRLSRIAEVVELLVLLQDGSAVAILTTPYIARKRRPVPCTVIWAPAVDEEGRLCCIVLEEPFDPAVVVAVAVALPPHPAWGSMQQQQQKPRLSRAPFVEPRSPPSGAEALRFAWDRHIIQSTHVHWWR